jgi:excisionase family DNA binding protein
MTSPENIQRVLLSTAEVARYLGISERFAKNLIYSGSLPSLKVGRLRRVRRDSLDRWIDRQGAEAKSLIPASVAGSHMSTAASERATRLRASSCASSIGVNGGGGPGGGLPPS